MIYEKIQGKKLAWIFLLMVVGIYRKQRQNLELIGYASNIVEAKF